MKGLSVEAHSLVIDGLVKGVWWGLTNLISDPASARTYPAHVTIDGAIEENNIIADATSL
jgi:hypothetical protein